MNKLVEVENYFDSTDINDVVTLVYQGKVTFNTKYIVLIEDIDFGGEEALYWIKLAHLGKPLIVKKSQIDPILSSKGV